MKRRGIRTVDIEQHAHALIYVEWLDSWSSDRWQRHDDALPDAAPLPCYSVGWLLADGAQGIVIAGNYGEQESCGRMTIPHSVITRRVVLCPAARA